MSDFSSYTHKWRAVPNNTTDYNKVSKRNRQPVSCQPCRVRKLKCDRGHPCEACVKRDEEDSCHYTKSSSTTSQNHGSHAKSSTSGHAQDRLQQLEDLVRQMIEPPQSDKTTSISQHSQLDDVGNKEGPLNRDRHGTHYTGSTHWSTILDQIQDLRTLISSHVSPHASDTPESALVSHSSKQRLNEANGQNNEISLFASHQELSLNQILDKYLPPRQNVNRLLSIFYKEKYVPYAYIHTAQFNREYDKFWQDTARTKTSPMWLSMLFSILAIGDMIRLAINAEFETGMLDQAAQQMSSGAQRTADSQSPESAQAISADGPIQGDSSAELNSLDFLSASAQLLVLGNYSRPQPMVVEALCIHNQAKYALSVDPNRDSALVHSILVRQAYSMSYHRDCSNFAPGQFSVFEAELRRRCWASIKQMDLMLSFQFGIPMNIAEASWDTQPPRNLLDIDFDEDSKFLPEPRSEAEPTQMVYFVVKTRLMDVYYKILRHILSFPQGDQSTRAQDTKAIVMSLDAEMRKVSESIPTAMRVKPISSSFSDPGWLIMLRTNLMFVVQKSLCVLHRKYMLPDIKGNGGDSTYSRRVVVEASSRIVNHFLDLHTEFQPGGQLARDWWMLGGFSVNDFLLSVMLLCFTFWMDRKKNLRSGSSDCRGDVLKWLERDDEARSIFETLGRAKCVCEIYGKTSSESKRVAEVLWVVLDKFASNDALSSKGLGNRAHMNGGLFTPSPQEQRSRGENEERERLDMTPLSINEHSTSSHGTHQEETTNPAHEATWTIVEAVPFKNQPRRPKGQPTTHNPTDPSQLVAHTAANHGNQTAHNTFPANGQSSAIPSDSNYTTLLAPDQAPEQDMDPFSSLLDTTNESLDMDWASFDQIVGNYHANTPFDFNSPFSNDVFSMPNPNPTSTSTIGPFNGVNGGMNHANAMPINMAPESMGMDEPLMSDVSINESGNGMDKTNTDMSTRQWQSPAEPWSNGNKVNLNGSVMTGWNSMSN